MFFCLGDGCSSVSVSFNVKSLYIKLANRWEKVYFDTLDISIQLIIL